MSVTEPVLNMEQEVREESIGREDEKSGVSCEVLPGEDNQVRVFGVHCWYIDTFSLLHKHTGLWCMSWAAGTILGRRRGGVAL